MKTLKYKDEIIRVKDDQVENFLDRGYSFTNKKEWKSKVRDHKSKEKLDEKINKN